MAFSYVVSVVDAKGRTFAVYGPFASVKEAEAFAAERSVDHKADAEAAQYEIRPLLKSA